MITNELRNKFQILRKELKNDSLLNEENLFLLTAEVFTGSLIIIIVTIIILYDLIA